MKKFLALLLTTCLLLSGCSIGRGGEYIPTGDALVGSDLTDTRPPEEKPEQVLDLVYYPQLSLNPLKSDNYVNKMVLSLVHMGLFGVDKNYEAVPLLCGSYAVSEDLMTYYFYLAPGATFSDGTAVTMNDVYASYQVAQETEMYRNRFYHFSDISVNEAGALVVQLDTAFENLPILMDIPIIKASEVDSDRPLGAGPYFFENSISGLQLRRRTNWWCESEDLAAAATSVSLTVAESPSQIRNEFQFANVDLVVADPGSDFYADYRGDFELWDMESGMFLYLGFNFNEDRVFSKASLRSQLTYMIDRETIAEKYYHGFGLAATLPASPNSPFYNRNLASKYVYEPEKMKAAVINGGLVGTEVKFLVNADDSLRLRVANFIKAELEDLGFKVTMIESTAYEYQYYLNMQDYDLYLAQTKLSANMDLSQFFYLYAPLCYGNAENEAAYALCEDALANQGSYYNLHKKVMDEGLICPILFHSYAVYATRGTVTDLAPGRDNVFFYTIGKSLMDIQVPLDE